MDEATLEALFQDTVDTHGTGPPGHIVMTQGTYRALRRAISRFHTRQNRARIMRRRRAIGRGRW